MADLAGAVAESASSLRPDGAVQPATLERPPKAEMGDYSTNAAMLLAPVLGKPPREIAEQLGDVLAPRLGADVDRVEAAGPGFLNLFMSDAWCAGALAALIAAAKGRSHRSAKPALVCEVLGIGCIAGTLVEPVTYRPSWWPPAVRAAIVANVAASALLIVAARRTRRRRGTCS